MKKRNLPYKKQRRLFLALLLMTAILPSGQGISFTSLQKGDPAQLNRMTGNHYGEGWIKTDAFASVLDAWLILFNVVGGARVELIELNLNMEASVDLVLKWATLYAKTIQQNQVSNIRIGLIFFNQTIEQGNTNVSYSLAAAGIKDLYYSVSATTPFSLYLKDIIVTDGYEDYVLSQEVIFNGTITLEELDFSPPVRITEIRATMEDGDSDGTNETVVLRVLLEQSFQASYSIQSQGRIRGFKNKTVTATSDYIISIANRTEFVNGEIPPMNEFIMRFNLMKEWRTVPEKVVIDFTTRMEVIYKEVQSMSLRKHTFYPVNSTTITSQTNAHAKRWKVEISFPNIAIELIVLILLTIRSIISLKRSRHKRY